jgi:hypothetical protein
VKQPPVFRGVSANKLGVTGFEPALDFPEKLGVAPTGGAKSGALGARTPELADVAGIWPTLPEAIRAAILAMIQAARREG